jgi:hypothetical protein
MSRGRRRGVKALVVVGSVLAFLSVFAIWIERQALNTDDWVHTSDRLIQNEKVRAALGTYLVEQLYANVDVEREFEEILPGETTKFAGPLSGLARSASPSGVENVLETSTAQGLWEDANRSAHEQLLAVLENKKEAVETSGGNVTLNLGNLITNLADQVGFGSGLAEKLPEDAGQITILRSDQLKTAQNIATALKGLALILSLLTFAAFGAAIYLSGDERWVTVLFCGAGLVAAGFAVVVAREVAGGIVVDQLVTNENVKPAAEETWSIATSLMTSIATTVIVIGVMFGVAGWLASPTGPARSTRRALAPALYEYPAYVYTGLAILVAIYLLSAPAQNLRTFLTTLAVAGLAAFGIHELRRQSHEENPDASYDELIDTAKARVSGAVKNANLGERASKLKLPEISRPDGGPSAGRGEDDARLERLEKLGKLHETGVLDEKEFAAEKKRVLAEDEQDD